MEFEDEETTKDSIAKPQVKVTGGSVYLRALPSTEGAIRGVAHKNDLFVSAGDVVNGWFPVLLDGEACYISGKYAEIPRE